jgi:hypothetical protein
MMVWKARQSQMVAQIRATAQASVGGDAAVDAFSEFRDLVNRVEIKDRSEKMKKQLDKLKDIKEIRFRPIGQTKRVRTMRTMQATEVAPDHIQPEGHKLKPIDRRTPKRKR